MDLYAEVVKVEHFAWFSVSEQVDVVCLILKLKEEVHFKVQSWLALKTIELKYQ